MPNDHGSSARPDERVVDRADREQRLAVAAPGGAELAEQADEVRLGDAELDVAAAGGLVPVHERLRVVREPVAPLAHRPDPRLVDPAAEVGGAGHVGADRDHPLGHLGGVVHEVDEEAAERLLGRFLAAVLAAERGRHLGRRARLRLVARERGRRRGRELALRAAGSKGAHGSSGSVPSCFASSPNCSFVSSAEWFSGWPSIGSDQPLIV